MKIKFLIVAAMLFLAPRGALAVNIFDMNGPIEKHWMINNHGIGMIANIKARSALLVYFANESYIFSRDMLDEKCNEKTFKTRDSFINVNDQVFPAKLMCLQGKLSKTMLMADPIYLALKDHSSVTVDGFVYSAIGFRAVFEQQLKILQMKRK